MLGFRCKIETWRDSTIHMEGMRGKKVEYFYEAYKNESQRNLLLHMGTKERGYSARNESLKWKNVFFVFTKMYHTIF